MSADPFISIITVVFNAREDIKKTIESVLCQSSNSYEFIVIDGGSTDGTLEIIRSFGDKIHQLVSETDRGIYDAMNKGIGRASGKWIYFLNAGDSFYSNDVLTNLESHQKTADLLYGRNEADYGYFRRINNPKDEKKLEEGMIFSHQAMIVKSDRMKQHLFDTTYHLSADFNFIYGLYMEGIEFQRTDYIFACLKAGGASEKNLLKTHRERRKIVLKHADSWRKKLGIQLRYRLNSIGILFKKFIKFILPTSMIRRLTMRKYQS
jgi:glycosyltransferase involved in cell wall biosynthesis